MGSATNAENVRIGVRREEVADPVRFSDRIVIQEEKDLSRRRCDAGVSSPG
jgi:hypothetical protein